MSYGFNVSEIIANARKHVYDIGPTPHGEECAQFGKPDFYEINPIECEAFREQLRRMFPEQCKIVSLVITRNNYDEGCYREVAVQFWSDHENIEAAAEAATFIEDNAPEFWDEEAKIYLAENMPTKEMAVLTSNAQKRIHKAG